MARALRRNHLPRPSVEITSILDTSYFPSTLCDHPTLFTRVRGRCVLGSSYPGSRIEPTRWARQAAYPSSWPRSQDHYILGRWIDMRSAASNSFYGDDGERKFVCCWYTERRGARRARRQSAVGSRPPDGGAGAQRAEGSSGRQLLAARQVRGGQDLRPHDRTRGQGGRTILGCSRAPGCRRDLRSRTPDQVRVVCDLEDPVVHPRRVEEGGPPDPPRAPAVPGSGSHQG